MSTEAMKQALEALEAAPPSWRAPEAQAALRTAIEQAEKQQALDKMTENECELIAKRQLAFINAEKSNIKQVIHLYDEPPAAPVQEPFDTHSLPGKSLDTHGRTPQQQLVGLTDEDYTALSRAVAVNKYQCRAIEAKLREKNGGQA